MRPPKFRIIQTEKHLTSHSGLALVGVILEKTGLRRRLDTVELEDHSKPEISHSENCKAMIGLLCLGKADFEAIESFRGDPVFQISLGLKNVPSSGTLRQRLDGANWAFDAILLEESADMVRRHASKITPCHGELIPLDIDVSPFDNSHTKKEGVSWTYKKVDGYAPIFGYLGGEGYLVNTELREGKQHCQSGTEKFLTETIQYAKRITEAPILVRMDSGNDSLENIKICMHEGCHWLIKRNLRHEDTKQWFQIAKGNGSVEEPRPGKRIYRGDIFVERTGFDTPLRIVFEVTERRIDSKGQMLLIPQIEVDTYWTSLDLPVRKVIDLYHAHGTSEQFHSELKTDMDLERLPSGKFATNALILLLGAIAYNILRLMGQESLRQDEQAPKEEKAPIRKKVYRRRLRSVIQDLMYMASRFVKHERRFSLSFGIDNPWYGTWRRVYMAFTGG
jgi:hypothetical protein